MRHQGDAVTSPNRLTLLAIVGDDFERSTVVRAVRDGGLDVVVVEAGDLREAHAALDREKFDCIVSDVAFTDGDGFDVLEMMRSHAASGPLVLLTNLGDELLAAELMRRGASDYCPKVAISPERIIQSILAAIRLRFAEARARDARRDLDSQASRLRRLVDASVRIHAASSRVRSEADIVDLAKVISVESKELVGAHQSVVQFDPATKGDIEIVASSSSPEHASGVVPEASLFESVRVAILDRSGNVCGHLSIFGPSVGSFGTNEEALITELAQTSSLALDNARLHLETKRVGASRDDVLTLVSHDLRNPMSTIAMSASLLREAATMGSMDSARQIVLVERIERALAKMDRLLDSLLEQRAPRDATEP